MASKTLYLAGKMRGIAEYNFPAFDEWAARLRAAGYRVISPAEMDRTRGFNEHGMTGDEQEWQDGDPLRQSMADDLYFIAKDAHGIALIPGEDWKTSLGAVAETHAAHAVHIPVHSADTWIRLAAEDRLLRAEAESYAAQQMVAAG